MDPIDQYSIDGPDMADKVELGSIMPSINNNKLCNDVIIELEEPDVSLLLSNAHTKKEQFD